MKNVKSTSEALAAHPAWVQGKVPRSLAQPKFQRGQQVRFNCRVGRLGRVVAIRQHARYKRTEVGHRQPEVALRKPVYLVQVATDTPNAKWAPNTRQVHLPTHTNRVWLFEDELEAVLPPKW
jgi:hypothetical protein